MYPDIDGSNISVRSGVIDEDESCISDGVDLVAGQVALEMARYALVKQQLHFRAAFA